MFFDWMEAAEQSSSLGVAILQHDLETEITIIVISKLAPNLWI